MGTWGAGIFSDDEAQDLREEWIEAFKTCADASKATAQVRREMREEFSDSDDGPVVKLALALTLWKYGHLDDRTKRDALDVINKKRGLALWREQGPAAERARLAEYAKVKKKLLSKQPPPKVVKRPANVQPADIEDPGLRSGDVFSIPLLKHGKGRGFFRVAGIEKKRLAWNPKVQLLDVPPTANPKKVKWSSVKAVGIRKFYLSDQCNERQDACKVYNWDDEDWNRQSVEVHTRGDSARRKPPRRSNRALNEYSWRGLARLTVASLDQSHWLDTREVLKLFQSMPISEIAGSRSRIKREVERTHRCFDLLYNATCLLIYEAGDYQRAMKVLGLASALNGHRNYTVLRAHILFGLGEEKKAESPWKTYMEAIEARGISSEISYYRKEIRASRQEVVDRRNGKPHQLPKDLLI